jgi:hypothetical protein
MGVFDRMEVYENGVQVTYYLNGFTWELVSEQPFPESLKNLEDRTLEHILLFRDRDQVERSDSNDNHDMDTEQIDTNEPLGRSLLKK